MCGICGKLYLDRDRRVSADEIDRMRDTMRSRGPTASGTHVDRHVGIGHRRLSIIDLEASVQPMGNGDGTVWIVFNGEIYNFAELRQDLIARGHRFNTSGDTEVILRLYEEYGADCVTWLRGMFAFAIWDARTETLFAARDRIGIKPLYYLLDRDMFLFGSELKALVADRDFAARRTIDLAAVHSYLTFLSVPDPVSIYEGVRKLPAGHTLTLRNGELNIARYWDVRFHDEEGIPEAEWEARLSELLHEAVRIRLVADVPLGAFLSGGIDSSAVVAIMSRLMDRPVKTFSIGFSDKDFNEASDARIVADHLRTDHTELILHPNEARSVIPGLLAHFDEPFADSSAIPTYYVSRLAGEQVTVVLSGDGGDELFGGYPWRQLRPRYQQQLSRLPQPVRTVLSRLARTLPKGIPGGNFLRQLDKPYERYILDAMAVFDDSDRRALYSGSLAEAVQGLDPYRHHLPFLGDGAGRSWPARMMEYDVKTYLPNDILTKVDRMSMLTSIEARVPLLDHRLVELAARIPSSLKLRDGVSKYILKRVVAPYLPEAVLSKRKQGFSVPLATWLRTVLKDDIVDALHGGNRHGLFDPSGLRQLADAFFRGDDSRNHQVFALYAFEVWYRDVHGRS